MDDMGLGLELRHYNNEPVAFGREVIYDQCLGLAIGKPNGFWVSVGNDWESWCRDSEFRLEYLAVIHRVTLSDDANILWITTPEQLDEFHAEYSHEREGWPKIGDREFDFRKRFIDWEVVSQKYDGIIITPYIYSRRLDGPFWYYGWDCASGVIWNLQAIKDVEVIEEKT